MLLIALLSIAIGIFVIGNAARMLELLRMPVPLRWELYPIPKGPRERQRYGGSYFEESDWWTRPQNAGRRGELIFMAKEVLFLRSVRDNFPALWLPSWLLHWGMYLYLAGVLSAVAIVPGLKVSALAATLFGISCAAGLLGSASVLLLRVWHPRLRAFTSRGAILNLLLLASIFASGLLALMTSPIPLDAMLRTVERSTASPILITHLVLAGFFLAYFPFTHMTHAYMKFFAWHGVRWDDRPAMRTPRAAETLTKNLRRKVAWAAPHIADHDAATWVDVVADNSGRGAAKRA